MWAAILLALITLAGCAAKKPAQAPRLKLGDCSVQAIDPKGQPSEMHCKFKDGSESSWQVR